jgi:hypothetical protein
VAGSIMPAAGTIMMERRTAGTFCIHDKLTKITCSVLFHVGSHVLCFFLIRHCLTTLFPSVNMFLFFCEDYYNIPKH